MLYEIETPGPASVLEMFCKDGGEQGDEVVYGTSDGRVGLVQVTRCVFRKLQWEKFLFRF